MFHKVKMNAFKPKIKAVYIPMYTWVSFTLGVSSHITRGEFVSIEIKMIELMYSECFPD